MCIFPFAPLNLQSYILQSAKDGVFLPSLSQNSTSQKLIPIKSLFGIFWGFIFGVPFTFVKSTEVISILSKLPTIVNPDSL